MLILRDDQLNTFKELATQQFEDEMLVHSRHNFPEACETRNDGELRALLRRTMLQSASYGFSCRGPMRTYIELTLLFGSGFDTDPQYSLLTCILKGSGHQMSRADLLYKYILDYQSAESG